MQGVMTQALVPHIVVAATKDLAGWHYSDGALKRTFRFKSFREAIGFLVRIAFEAESLNHHPEISNVYNSVTLTLRTHDAENQVTEKDIQLARAIQTLSWVD